MTDGILIVDKPKGITSRDVVNEVGKVLHTKKIGHTGTLDPIATGVLVLTIGKATKLTEIITSEEKEYIATALLGIETDTLDSTGNILKEQNCHFSKEQIINILTSFEGSYLQEVPLYSAVKVNGKKLYEYARSHIEVKLPKKEVTIKKIELLEMTYLENKMQIQFRCLVSKGTYIRSLIKDIAYKLNTVGIMTDLRRVKQGNYFIENSTPLDDILNGNYHILPIQKVLEEYYTVVVDKELEYKIKNGQAVPNLYNQEYVLFKNEKILGLYKEIDGKLKPFKMFL